MVTKLYQIKDCPKAVAKFLTFPKYLVLGIDLEKLK
jgi:hypothetical protein